MSNRKGYTTLHIAATSGELTILKYFDEDRLVNAATESLRQETPLHCTTENGHLSVIKYLAENQMVDPLAYDSQQFSSLHCACRRVGTLSQTVSQTTGARLTKPGALTVSTHLTEVCNVIQFLIHAVHEYSLYCYFACMQVDCNIEDDNTPLQELCMVLSEFKLSSDEPPSIREISRSRLHSAVFNGELANVQILVEVFHCSPLAVNREGLTALHTAAACGELTILKYFNEDRLVNAATESVGQKTPLHCAAENGHLAVVKYLVGTQLVDPLSLDELLRSPLHSACFSGSLSTVQYLIQECQQQPCDVNERTADGYSLIHYAALSGSPEVVHALLTSRCDYNIDKEDINNTDKVRHNIMDTLSGVDPGWGLVDRTILLLALGF